MTDLHVHAREDQTGLQNYKEDYATVEAAALAGGVLQIAVMPNTPHPLIDTASLEWHRKRCEKSEVHILHYAGIGPGTAPLAAQVPYKVYTGPSVGQLFFKSEKELREALRKYRGEAVSFHVEDYDVLERHAHCGVHDQRRPPECVEVALKYVLDIVEEFALKAKLCHWSLGGCCLDLIKAHRKKGFETTIEVSPYHLFFDSDFTNSNLQLWPYLQMNPSLQGKEHRLDLIKALREGDIDFLATDHAPHTLQEKFKHFGNSELNYLELLQTNKQECIKLACLNSISGTPQLDTFGPFTCWLMSEHGFRAQDIARVASENPGKYLNQFHKGPGKFGRIEVGYYGSFTVIDPKKPTTINREKLKTKVGWSPFEGTTFPGSVVSVIVKGRKIF
eukprot:TRINITY_DN7356_c0_g1_i1.p1 TRINITY_DN7356_c0_g1~~TRINITY_DN7356_c0_g1_i1.p1  ORF type:complete len:446 (-),score=96.77 TRINITY_DN7356_c0_g1_i1:9-1178(-)